MTKCIGIPSKLKKAYILVYNVVQTTREGGIILTVLTVLAKINKENLETLVFRHFYPILLISHTRKAQETLCFKCYLSVLSDVS